MTKRNRYLDKEKLAALIQKVQAEDRLAERELLLAYDKFIKRFVESAKRKGMLSHMYDEDDAYVDLMMEFIDKVRKYDPNKGISFTSFMSIYLNHKIYEECDKCRYAFTMPKEYTEFVKKHSENISPSYETTMLFLGELEDENKETGKKEKIPHSIYTIQQAAKLMQGSTPYERIDIVSYKTPEDIAVNKEKNEEKNAAIVNILVDAFTPEEFQILVTYYTEGKQTLSKTLEILEENNFHPENLEVKYHSMENALRTIVSDAKNKIYMTAMDYPHCEARDYINSLAYPDRRYEPMFPWERREASYAKKDFSNDFIYRRVRREKDDIKDDDFESLFLATINDCQKEQKKNENDKQMVFEFAIFEEDKDTRMIWP